MILTEARLFKEIVQTKSITKAASHLGITQSAATQQVHNLEKRLRLELFDRTTRPFGLTQEGKLFYDFCRDVVRREDQLEADLQNLANRVEGEVRVASIYSVGLSEMSHLREEFERRYPDAALHVDYMRPDKIYDAILADQADLGLVSYAEPTRELAVIDWRKEEMTVAAAPSHPLAARRLLYPADLAGQAFVAFDPDLSIRRELDRFFDRHGIQIQVVMQFDNIQTVKEAVALGSGLSILPSRTMQAELEQGRLVSIPLDAPELARPVGIVHRRRKVFSRAAQMFLALLQEQPLE